jgi:replicative DNA helicase Mcm
MMRGGIDEYDVYDIADEFYPSYGYGDDIADIERGKAESLNVSWKDVHQWHTARDSDGIKLPELILKRPDEAFDYFEAAVEQFDLPTDTNLSNPTVRFYDLPEAKTRQLHELDTDDTGRLRSVTGTIEQVTKGYEKPLTVAYNCLASDGCQNTVIRQPGFGDIKEPSECEFCGRRGPFEEIERKSDYSDEVRIKFKQPASEAPDNSGQTMMVVARDNLLKIDGQHLQTHVGSKATITAVVKRKDADIDGMKERWLLANHIHVDDAMTNPVNIEEHLSTIKDYASREDCLDLWVDSLAPQLHEAWKWPTVKRLAVAWLFSAPRIEYDGTVYRGDIHAGVISDPGMAKSLFCRELRQYSAKCMHRSATGISSDVGLTAAAVQDSTFGSGQPTLRPGILVRGNGGHVIIEEIDKGPDNLERMNDGLEGDQRITVDKWGINADLETRIGLFVTGNPVDGSFNPQESVPEQVDIDHSLLSRFDGLITMQDQPDEEIDRGIADTIGQAYQETAEAQYGDREEFEQLDRAIEPEVGRAWVSYARDNIHPIPTDDAIQKLSEWFAEDVRQLNDDDNVVPVTTRKMETGLRIASAFARLRLSEKVDHIDAERAIKLSKEIVGENYDVEAGVFNAGKLEKGTTAPQTQEERKNMIFDAIKNASEPITVPEIAGKVAVDPRKIKDEVENMKQSGELYTPDGEGNGYEVA